MRATPSPRITIRYGCVSLLKHTTTIYATPAFRIYLALLTVALSGAAAAPASEAAPHPAAAPALRPWRAHVREAREYAQTRAGEISFGVRTRRGLRGCRRGAGRAVGERRQGDAA